MHSLTVPLLFCVLSIAIGQVAANAACQVPFQQHPTREDLCYTRLPKRKCDWIPGSVFLSGNCFVPSGHDVVPSKKFFCDFNEYFQHCQNVPGHCCMQSTKFECDKYNNVTYDATVKTCFAPVSEIEIRTAANVVCPKFFEWDDSFRQCVADVNVTEDHQLTPDECRAIGGHVNGTKCNRDPERVPDLNGNCTVITDQDCSPPPFPTTPPTTVETTEPTTTDEPETTTVTDSTTSLPTKYTTISEPTEATTDDGLTTTTPLPSTSGTESTTFIPTTTTNSNVTSTTITPPTAGTTGVTGSTPADITGTSTPPSTGSPNDGSSSGDLTTTPSLPTTPGTSETTYNPTATTGSNNVTATTTTTPITETTVVTNSGTVTTTTPGPFTTLNFTSDGAPTTSTPPSTGAPPSPSTLPPTPTGLTTSDPTESTTPLPNGPKLNGTVPRGFNVSHNCPIGYMITEHFCIGVYTPDCETSHNGYKYEEACFIRFNDSGSNVGKREIASDDIPKGTVAPVSILSTLLTKPTTLPSTNTPISTTTTTTTTTPKPTTKPSTTKRPVTPPRPKCRDHFRNCLQLKNDGNCDILNRRKEMMAYCSRTCGFCK